MIPLHGIGWESVKEDAAEDAAVDFGAHFFLREFDAFEGLEEEGAVFIGKAVKVAFRTGVGIEDFPEPVLSQCPLTAGPPEVQGAAEMKTREGGYVPLVHRRRDTAFVEGEKEHEPAWPTADNSNTRVSG